MRADGVSDFERLRAVVGRKGSRDAFLMVFDVLEFNGTDLGRELWEERRKVLARLLRGVGPGWYARALLVYIAAAQSDGARRCALPGRFGACARTRGAASVVAAAATPAARNWRRPIHSHKIKSAIVVSSRSVFSGVQRARLVVDQCAARLFA